MSMGVPVSVIVPIKNEAANLPRCLACVKWADEIFVVDSASTDSSIAIAQQHGAKVVQFEFNAIWPKKKTGRSSISPSETNGFLFSMPTKFCRRKPKRNLLKQSRTPGILRDIGSIVGSCSWDVGCGMPTTQIGICGFFDTHSAVMKN